MELLQTIEYLSGLAGVSGDEDAVREAIIELLDGCCTLRTDPLGNLIAHKKGRQTPSKRLLFSAHMDEVGFIITHIEENGLLRFAPVGGIDSRVVFGKSVRIGEQRLPGVIGAKALHQCSDEEKETPAKLSDLYIDIGAESREQAEEFVLPGDRAIFDSPFLRFGDGKILAKALDDRAGCALLVHLAKSDLPYDCTFSFTVQEETGCTGGVTAGYTAAPDIAVAIETTTASDIAGVPEDKTVCALGKGPVVSFMDRGAIYDHALYRLALSAAEKRRIPIQAKEGVYGGNESRSLQVAGNGAQVMAVSLPCRYLHSPSCVIQQDDIDSTYRLLEALIEELGAR